GGGAGEHHKIRADDDVAAALEEIADRQNGHGAATVGVESSDRLGGGGGGIGRGWGGRLGRGGGGGGAGRDRPRPRDDREDGGHGRADEPQLTPVGETAGDENDGSGDEDAEADPAVGDAAVAGRAGVRGDALGHADEDQARGDPRDRADAALPDEVRGQRHRGQPQSGDDEAEAVDEPVGFDPALGDDEGADEVADVVQRRDPRPGGRTPVQGGDHQRQCRGVEEPSHAHRHGQAQRSAGGSEGGTAEVVGHGGSSR